MKENSKEEKSQKLAEALIEKADIALHEIHTDTEGWRTPESVKDTLNKVQRIMFRSPIIS